MGPCICDKQCSDLSDPPVKVDYLPLNLTRELYIYRYNSHGGFSKLWCSRSGLVKSYSISGGTLKTLEIELTAPLKRGEWIVVTEEHLWNTCDFGFDCIMLAGYCPESFRNAFQLSLWLDTVGTDNLVFIPEDILQVPVKIF